MPPACGMQNSVVSAECGMLFILQINPSGVVIEFLDDDARGLLLMADAGVHLLENNVAVADAANFKFADVVSNYIFETFPVSAQARPGLIHNGYPLLQRKLKRNRRPVI